MVQRWQANEAGLTLVEILVTVILMGTAFVSILSGMTLGIVSSDVHRKQADTDTIMKDFADYVVQTGSYVECSDAAAMKSEYVTTGANRFTFTNLSGDTVSLDVTDVRFGDGAGAFLPSGTKPASCSSATPKDAGVQKIALEARSDSGRATESVTVIKRRP